MRAEWAAKCSSPTNEMEMTALDPIALSQRERVVKIQTILVPVAAKENSRRLVREAAWMARRLSRWPFGTR